MLAIHDFTGDYRALGAKVIPPLSVKEVKASIMILKKLGLVAPNEKGFLMPTENALCAPEHFKDELIRQLQVSIIDRAKTALVENSAPHLMALNTISVSRIGRQRIKKAIEKFRSELQTIVNKDENTPEQVFHFIIGFFPSSQL